MQPGTTGRQHGESARSAGLAVFGLFGGARARGLYHPTTWRGLGRKFALTYNGGGGSWASFWHGAEGDGGPVSRPRAPHPRAHGVAGGGWGSGRGGRHAGSARTPTSPEGTCYRGLQVVRASRVAWSAVSRDPGGYEAVTGAPHLGGRFRLVGVLQGAWGMSQDGAMVPHAAPRLCVTSLCRRVAVLPVEGPLAVRLGPGGKSLLGRRPALGFAP